MVSEALQRAREYEAEFACPEAGRPVFHMTPTVGWMNDPNGFSVYQGEYHLFYQYHPYSTNWGPMHWGHVKTKDFIKWERLPAALAPDQAYDKGGCFSGSALELPDGRQLLVYTGVQQYAEADGTMKDRQAQCIAIGDGIDYEKSGLNPVLNETALPPGGSPADFRDPKIWQEPDGSYRLVAANRAGDGSGAALLFGSRDALHWDLLSTLDASGWKFGGMWECPDCFRLGDRQVLMLSPQEMLPVGLDFHAGNNTAWLIGRMEPGSIAFVRQIVQPVDYGIDFYAPPDPAGPGRAADHDRLDAELGDRRIQDGGLPLVRPDDPASGAANGEWKNPPAARAGAGGISPPPNRVSGCGGAGGGHAPRRPWAGAGHDADPPPDPGRGLLPAALCSGRSLRHHAQL